MEEAEGQDGIVEGRGSPGVRSSEAVKYLCAREVARTGDNLCHSKKQTNTQKKQGDFRRKMNCM